MSLTVEYGVESLLVVVALCEALVGRSVKYGVVTPDLGLTWRGVHVMGKEDVTCAASGEGGGGGCGVCDATSGSDTVGMAAMVAKGAQV